jgi:hypothetical protein
MPVPSAFAQRQAQFFKGKDFSFTLPNGWTQITKTEYEHQAAVYKQETGTNPPEMELGFHLSGREPFELPNMFISHSPPGTGGGSFSEIRTAFQQAGFMDSATHSIPPKLVSLFGSFRFSNARFLDAQKIVLLDMAVGGDSDVATAAAFCVGKSQWVFIYFYRPTDSLAKYDATLQIVVSSFKWNTQ